MKDLANPVRGDRLHRRDGDGADYFASASCHGLTPRRIRQIVNPGRVACCNSTDPSTEKEITEPFLNLHAIPAGGR